MSLYRSEAIDAQRKRLYGVVTIHQPASFALMTTVAVVATCLTIVFLSTGSFARKESVTGWIVPAAGLSEVYTEKAGVTNAVNVKVGDTIERGQTLAAISTDLSGPQGGLAPQQRAMTLDRIAELNSQIAASELKENGEAARLSAHAIALRDETVHLEAEKELLDQQLSIAKRQVADIAPLIAKGFVTTLERDRREQIVFSTEQSITDMTRQIGAKRADAADTDALVKALPVATAVELSQLRAQKSSLAQTVAELTVEDKLLLRAPIRGTVAAVNIRVGDNAAPNTPLFAIAPAGSKLQAEILAPTQAAGFLASGQTVRLKVDAFPSERFGEVSATIETVSRAPITAEQAGIPLDVKGPVYRVTARLGSEAVIAYGKAQPLQPGMTLKASIVTAKRTFLQWLTDPLLAAKRNLS